MEAVRGTQVNVIECDGWALYFRCMARVFYQ